MLYSNKLPIAVTVTVTLGAVLSFLQSLFTDMCFDYSIIALSVTVGAAVTVTIGVAVSVVASFFTFCNSFELALLD